MSAVRDDVSFLTIFPPIQADDHTAGRDVFQMRAQAQAFALPRNPHWRPPGDENNPLNLCDSEEELPSYETLMRAPGGHDIPVDLDEMIILSPACSPPGLVDPRVCSKHEPAH